MKQDRCPGPLSSAEQNALWFLFVFGMLFVCWAALASIAWAVRHYLLGGA